MDIIVPLIFYSISAILIAASVMVIVSSNPIRGALFLVLAFVASAVLWMLMEAEFLSLALIFVYVGAVMTLFLFVVMMLNIRQVPRSEGFVRYLPVGMLVMVLLLGIMIFAIGPRHFGLGQYGAPTMHGPDYSNVQELGEVLYTRYALPFELAGLTLLVAIIASISLTYRGTRPGTRKQNVPEQVATQPETQLRMVKVNQQTDPFSTVDRKCITVRISPGRHYFKS